MVIPGTDTKMFDGRKYHFHDAFSSKKSAKLAAYKFKHAYGGFARVVKVQNMWAIYVRWN